MRDRGQIRTFADGVYAARSGISGYTSDSYNRHISIAPSRYISQAFNNPGDTSGALEWFERGGFPKGSIKCNPHFPSQGQSHFYPIVRTANSLERTIPEGEQVAQIDAEPTTI